MEQEGKHRRVHRSDANALRHDEGKLWSWGVGKLVMTTNRHLGGGLPWV
jgi:hypothetical protein